MSWLRRQARRRGAVVRVEDVTGNLATYALWGPHARHVLREVTGADLSNDAHPFMTAREITVDDVPVRALRVTFAGELGLGALRAQRVRRPALDDALGGRPSRTGWSPAATGRSRACGWRRATGSGAPTSPRRPTRGRRAWASASSSTSRAASRAPTRCAR